MSNHFERYSCQMTLPGFGEETQKLLQNAKVLVMGAGGLGCPALQYLAAAGIGTIGIADDDTVSESNLHRQILYSPADVGKLKTDIAAKKLKEQNPSVHTIGFPHRVTSENIMPLIADYDLIIEGTDNFGTKALINDACVLSGKPLVYGAIYQYEGQVAVWNVKQADGTFSANYRDVFPNAENAQAPDCREGGVIPTLAGIIGCMQANEAIKFFTKPEELLAGKLWILNVLDSTVRTIRLKKQSGVKITELPQSVATIVPENLQSRDDYELIDVRSGAEHRSFNIGGKNIPLDELEKKWDEINFSLPVVCYCSTGKRSAVAVNLLKKQFPGSEVYSLKGGIEKRV